MEISPSSFVLMNTDKSNIDHRRVAYCFSCPPCLVDLCTFLIYLMTLGIFVILPIIEITIGSVYQNQCPINVSIPFYLIVNGIFSLFFFLVAVLIILLCPSVNNLKLKNIKSMFNDATMTCKILVIVILVFLLFGFINFIIGNVWIFSIQSNVQYTDAVTLSNSFCHRTVYLCGFWSIILTYMFVFVICCRWNCHVAEDIEQMLDQTPSNPNTRLAC